MATDREELVETLDLLSYSATECIRFLESGDDASALKALRDLSNFLGPVSRIVSGSSRNPKEWANPVPPI